MELDDYKFIEDNIDLVKKIVINSSCSFLPIVYRDRMLQLGKKYGFINCSTCNTSIYLATCKLYDLYLADKNVNTNKNIEKQNERSNTRNGKRSSKKQV